MKNFSILVAVSISIILISSCSQHNKINKFNTASTYVDEFSGKFMQQQVYHMNDSISELAIKIDAAKIPGLKTKQIDIYSLMTFRYEVYTSMDKKDLIQSDSYKLSDLVPYDQMEAGGVVIKIPLQLLQNNNYIVLLSLQDQVSKKNFFKMLRISKSVNSPENFKITNENNELLWFPWIVKDQKIKIEYRYPEQKKIFVRYYKPKFSPAKSPYNEVQSTEIQKAVAFEKYELPLTQGKSHIIHLPQDGVYILSGSSNQVQGKLLTQFHDNYPIIKNNAQRVFTLRYLNAKKEFYNMIQDDPAHTIQEFWFFEGRTKERSQEMMNTYYSRAQRANELFSSYKEGWKTDRGMIFMIYGPPDQIYNEVDREVWEYGAEASYNGLRFEFLLTNTSLNSQEFILLRNNDFKSSWYSIVENWRTE